jgi:L-ascorbate metabolism protein UlaG (beta-lactamase superfamily)
MLVAQEWRLYIVKIQLIRNATLRMEYGGHILLTDPYFAPKHSLPSYAGISKNPLVDLPITINNILNGVEMILLSHNHSDHFDSVAQSIISKSSLIVCQPDDKGELQKNGYTNIISVEEKLAWGGIHIERIYGRHGSGEVLTEMGNASGYFLSAANEPSIFWAGDTILFSGIIDFILEKEPDIIIIHACGALWNQVKIVMDEYQAIELCGLLSKSVVIAIHMDVVDHAKVSRKYLREFATNNGISDKKLIIPRDGEVMNFSNLPFSQQ